jgi:acyl-CoA thioesterase FadM
MPDSTETNAHIVFTDLYTRHFREQLLGANLEVWGGVLEVRDEALRMYSELVNVDREELAATFVNVLQIQDADTGARLPLPENVLKSARDAIVPWPVRGRPRSIELDCDLLALPLGDARAHGLEWRKPRVIGDDECGPDGLFRSDFYRHLVWGGERIDSHPLPPLDKKRTTGWATMESRAFFAEIPKSGTHVQCFGAEIELGAKTRHARYWIYDLDRETLLCTSTILNVAFDIPTRKAIEIPDDERARLALRLHPDLR